jgi:formate dehydrogenase subunit gamma
MSVKAEAHNSAETFVRFAASQRLEHVLLIVSFSLLGFTGLIQKFNQVSLAENLIMLLGGIETVRLIHRTFALILVIESVYHVVATGYKFLTKRARPTMLPTPKDIVDAWQMILYFLGKRQERPLFDHFDFRQKIEYWAMVWGTIVMAVTGFAMWFPIQTTNLMPGEIIPAAKAAHGAEAILAVLSIIIWHMYNAHLLAEVFPMDKTIFSGKISTERMLHEHPLEYAHIMEVRKNAQLVAQAADAQKAAATQEAAANKPATGDTPAKK